MALNFPSSPSLNQEYSSGGKTWKWDGTAWVAYNAGTLQVYQGGTGATTAVGAKDNLDTGKLEPNIKSSSYTLAATDVGDIIIISAGDITVPPSVFSGGQVVTIWNNNGSTARNILRGSGVTMYWVNGANANRVLGITGVATILCVSSNVFVISGQGLS